MELDHKRRNPDTEKLLNFLSGRVIGQDRALRYLASSFARMNSNLRNNRRPIGSFLFLGPSGVGKTETARALALYLFENPEGLTHIDCTAFSQPHEVSKLKGSPPGYVGFKEAGKEYDSPYPYLSRWNVYRHHHAYFQKIHQIKIQAVMEKQNEAERLQKEVEALSKKMIKLKKEIRDHLYIKDYFSKYLDSLKTVSDITPEEKQNQESILVKLPQLEELLKKCSEEAVQLGKKMEATQSAVQEFRGDLDKDIAEMTRIGWLYNPDNPSDKLMAIVLFDELEKADPSLHHHIMEILDTGRFQCGNGEEVPFKNSFIIGTSNVGQRQISEELNSTKIGFRGQDLISEKDADKKIYEIAMEALKKEFDQEFLNRFDKIVVFHPLNRESLSKILDIRIQDLADDLEKNKFPLKLEFDPMVKEYLIDRALSRTEEGARLLDKRLDSYIRDGLAALETTSQIQAGDKIVIKLKEDGKLAFEKE